MRFLNPAHHDQQLLSLTYCIVAQCSLLWRDTTAPVQGVSKNEMCEAKIKSGLHRNTNNTYQCVAELNKTSEGQNFKFAELGRGKTLHSDISVQCSVNIH